MNNEINKCKLFERYSRYVNDECGCTNSVENINYNDADYALNLMFSHPDYYLLTPKSYYDLEIKLTLRGY